MTKYHIIKYDTLTSSWCVLYQVPIYYLFYNQDTLVLYKLLYFYIKNIRVLYLDP